MEKNKIARPCKVLIIGGSAGSIEVIMQMLPEIKKGFSFSIVIVLHRKGSSESSLSELFSLRTEIPAKEIEDKEVMLPGNIYIAPPDYHLLFEKDNTFSLDFSEKVNYSRPSIDVTFESASDIFGKDLTCLVLSGANSDGAEGMRFSKKNGGQSAVQDPDTAESFFMPEQAIHHSEVDFILKPYEMAGFINTLSK